MDSDSELLQRFAATGDEMAFSILVGRHAGMVQGVAWRRTQDWAMTEEITQNVFAILARKAKALRHESLAGWLHHAASLEARNARRKAARYRDALQQFSDQIMNMPSSGDSSWDQIRPHLDEALSRLPAEARHLVVMRYLERRSISEIASATGKSAEACRKRIQRSLQRLDCLLQKRGLSSTGTSLTAMLAGQNLCISPSSAAAIAAAALKSAPSLTTASLIAHTFHIMNTATTIKISAVALAIAAIPITILWKQNAQLQATVRRLETASQSSPAPPQTFRTASPSSREAQVASSPVPTALQGPAEGAPAAGAADPADRSMEEILERAQDKSKRRANLEFTRICLNLGDLTTEQKQQIKEAIERKSLAALDEMMKAFQSGAVARGIQSPQSLTNDEKVALAKIDPRKTTPVTVDEELKSILTDEQHDLYIKTQETKRVSDAEDVATDTLKFIGRSFDLSAHQKDQIFQQLAQHELSRVAVPAEDNTDAFPQIGAREDARDQIIRANLTPQQAEVFDHTRAAERQVLKQQMMEFYSKPQAGQQSGKG